MPAADQGVKISDASARHLVTHALWLAAHVVLAFQRLLVMTSSVIADAEPSHAAGNQMRQARRLRLQRGRVVAAEWLAHRCVGSELAKVQLAVGADRQFDLLGPARFVDGEERSLIRSTTSTVLGVMKMLGRSLDEQNSVAHAEGLRRRHTDRRDTRSVGCATDRRHRRTDSIL